jgi:trimeric autotransporter adhesin
MRSALLVGLLALTSVASGQPCQWVFGPEQEPPGFYWGSAGSISRVHSLWDPDGAGPLAPVLVMTGPGLQSALGGFSQTIKTWNGQHWGEIPHPPGSIYGLVVHEGHLVAAGFFQTPAGSRSGLYRYAQGQWHFESTPVGMSSLRALLVRGSEIFSVSDILTSAVWRWDGAAWHDLGRPPSPSVSPTSGVIHQGELYVGSNAGGAISRWDGQQWVLFSSGSPGPFTEITTLASIGGSLYAGSLDGVYRHDGAAWVQLGQSIGLPARAIAEFQGSLYIGIISSFAPVVYRLTGQTWVPLATASQTSSSSNGVLSFAEYQGELYAGGGFEFLNGRTGALVARFDGAAWKPLGGGASSEVMVLSTFEGHPVAGGWFRTMGGDRALNLAIKRPGFGWTELGGGLQGFNPLNISAAFAAIEHEGRLIVAGSFRKTGDISHNSIAAWDGDFWHQLGGGVNGQVLALAAHDQDIIAAGFFSTAGGAPANNIARWDGVAWHPLGEGINGNGSALLVHGDDLYVGGAFTQAGGQPALRIARWDGAAWMTVGEGFNERVHALRHYGGEILAGGEFTASGAMPVRGIARLAGGSWQQVPHDFSTAVVHTMRPWRGRLLLGGLFASSSPSAVGVVVWDGVNWSALAESPQVPPIVRGIVADGDDLVFGGSFTVAGDRLASRIGRLSCGPECYANCDGSTAAPLLNIDDFTCFINAFAAASALPHAQQLSHYANCDGSTVAPVLNVDDFACFINAFAAGCP